MPRVRSAPRKPAAALRASSWLVLLAAAHGSIAAAATWGIDYSRGVYPMAASAIVQVSDGTQIMAGSTASIAALTRGWILRADSAGEVLGAWRLANAEDSNISSLAGAGADGLLASGRLSNPADISRSHSGVVRLGPDLSARWSIRMAADLILGRRAVRDSPDGFLFINDVGSVATGRDVWLARIDEGGSIPWSVTLVGAGDQRITSAIPLTGGGGLGAGSDDPPSSTRPQGLLVRVASDGSIAWQVAVSAGSSTDVQFNALAEMADGSFIAIGTATAGGRDSALLCHVDSGGALVSATSLTAGSNNLAGLAVACRADGSMLIGGEAGDPASTNAWLWLAILDPGLVPVASELIGQTGAGAAVASASANPDGFRILTQWSPAQPSPIGGARLLQVGPMLELDAPCMRRLPEPIASAPTSLTIRATAYSPTPLPVTITPEPFELVPMIVQARPVSGDVFESDDACGDAKVLRGGETQAHDFCDDSTDLFRVHANAGASYRIDSTDLGLAADTFIEVLDATCSTVLAASAGPPGGGEQLAWTAPGDREFVIRATQQDGTAGPDREYEISLTGSTAVLARWSRTVNSGDLTLGIGVVPLTNGYLATSVERLFWLGADGAPLRREEGVTSDELTRTPDGGSLLSGRARAGSATVQKRDAAGTVEWEEDLVAPTPFHIRGLAATTDRGALVAGRSAGDLVVARLQPGGALAWSRIFDTSLPYDSTRVAEMTNGDVVAAAVAPFASNDEVLLVRLDAAGDPVWTEALDTPADETFVSGVVPLPDGSCIVAATLGIPGDYVQTGDSWIARVRADGTIAWAETLGGGPFTHLFDVEPTRDGTLLLSGRADAWPPGSGDGILVELDVDGGILWQASYDAGGYRDVLIAVTPLADGGAVASGHTGARDTSDFPYQGWILRVGPGGDFPDACTMRGDASIVASAWNGLVTSQALPVRTDGVSSSRGATTFTADGVGGIDLCVLGVVPREVSPAASAEPLLFVSHDSLAWENAAASGADDFSIYRGLIPDLRLGDYGSCLQAHVPVESWVDPTLPGSGNCFFYLVAARNRFGEGPVTSSWPFALHDADPPCP